MTNSVTNKYSKLIPLALTCCSALLGSAASAATQPTLKYLWIYADSKGESHFKEERFTFNVSTRSKNLSNVDIVGAQGGTLLRLEAGAVEDFHTAPRRWFLIAVQGESEVTASDGEIRRLKPGMIMLMDDTTGKGHRTRAVGKIAHIALTVPVPVPVPDDAAGKK